jgi:cell division septation protein DedD
VTAPQPYVQPAPAATPASNPAAKSAAAAPAAPAASTASKPATATGVFVSVPEVGSSYWQVTAIGRPTADDLVRTLREGKLPAILAESSKSDLFRVLVGPYRSQLTLSDAKKKLTELGYNGLIVQKY